MAFFSSFLYKIIKILYIQKLIKSNSANFDI